METIIKDTINSIPVVGLSLQGRFGRLNYFRSILLLNILAFLVFLALTFLVGMTNMWILLQVLFPLIIFIYIYLNLRAAILRLHDLNRPGSFVLLFFVPFINICFMLYLLFADGDKSINRYGSQTKQPSLLNMVIVIVLYIIVAIFTVAIRNLVYNR